MRAGIIFHGLLSEARDLAGEIADRYSGSGDWWLSAVEDTPRHAEDLDATEVLVTIGGDGTMLRAVHETAPRKIPIIGVNLGRVGFMSEIEAKDALDGLGWYLDGNARVDERTMIQAFMGENVSGPYHALNDVVLGRGSEIRLIDMSVVVNGVHLETYRADALVVATATGSTGYSLALGGPVMDPESRSFLLKPVAAHMSLQGGLVLPPGATVEMTLETESEAVCSVDGFVDLPVRTGESVRVEVSPHTARFLRRSPTTSFYESLTRRLGMRQGAVSRRDR
jgi:NAD+ kinase